MFVTEEQPVRFDGNHGWRLGLWAGVFVLALLFSAAAATNAAQAGAPRERLAAKLMRLDPGSLVGGNTQVSTAPEARLWGVPGRINFMLALGNRQRIMGGRGHDELGAYHGTRGVRIHGGGGPDLINGMRGNQLLFGDGGHDLIRGGRGRDRLFGGRGNDRLVDVQGATVAHTGPGRNRVEVADGDGADRVVCAPGSVNRIEADRGDRLHPNCRSGASTVRYVRPASETPAAHVAQQSGNGTNASPYIFECDPPQPQDVDCTTPYSSETLTGLFTHAYVPAYQCPDSHPWLLNTDYVPWGTTVPNGVEVQGLGPIGISITGLDRDPASPNPVNGTLTGGDNSSVTNWNSNSNTWSLRLHCTHSADRRNNG